MNLNFNMDAWFNMLAAHGWLIYKTGIFQAR
jgi:hypothetical protein